MSTGKRMPIDGEVAKPWRVYRINREGEQLSLIAEADSREELAKLYKRRLDWLYGIYHNRKHVE
jgi:hypothetical protein